MMPQLILELEKGQLPFPNEAGPAGIHLGKARSDPCLTPHTGARGLKAENPAWSFLMTAQHISTEHLGPSYTNSMSFWFSTVS